MFSIPQTKHGRNFSVAGVFLLIFLPLAILVVGIGVGLYQQERKTWREHLLKKEQLQVDFATRNVSEGLLDMVRDLLFLAGMIQNEPLPRKDDLKLWARQYKLFSDIKKCYDQIRLLGANGRELVRVNFHSAGSFATNQDDLQDKSRRYYFSQSIKLPKGRIYISPFDLNMERGKVERPFKPMVRLATPIFGQNGKPEMVLVLNALGQEILGHMKKRDLQSSGRIMLLNRRGYWLTGAPVKGYDWAFMFPNSADKKMPVLWPRPWLIINQKQSGQFQTGQGIFTFCHLCPYSEVPGDLSAKMNQEEMHKEDWSIISWLPDAWLKEEEAKARQWLFMGLAGVCLIMAVLIFSLVRIRHARRQYQQALLSANQELNQSLERMRRHNQIANTVNHLSDMVQACTSADEVYQVVTGLAIKVFPGYRGELAALSESKDLLVATRWGSGQMSPGQYGQDQCWAIRRGKPHLTAPGHRQPHCGHLEGHPDRLQLCVPLIAHGAAVGVLSLESLNGEFATSEEDINDLILLATNLAEMIALSLSNISLRESLREQSIRDPLTGLYNRRFMEESLTREEARAVRDQKPLSLIMMDVDYFKRFNDQYGHDVGDKVLEKLGAVLLSHSRRDDVACRYGGEEFLLILPGAKKSHALERAEHLRENGGEQTEGGDKRRSQTERDHIPGRGLPAG